MSKKNFIAVLFLMIGLALSSKVSIAQSPDAPVDIGQQAQQLAQQEKKVIEDYKRQKTRIEGQLQQKIRSLTTSPADRARRTQWMEDVSQKILELQESFKVEMDSIKEAENNLIHSQKNSPTGKKADLDQMRLEQERRKDLQERIKKQDAIFFKEKASLPQPQNIIPQQPVYQVPTVNEPAKPAVSDQKTPNNNSSSTDNKKKRYGMQ